MPKLKSIPFDAPHMERGVAYIKEPDKTGEKWIAVANTDALDRDQEVVLPKGCRIDQFMKNPVMLDIHDYRSHAVGKVTDIEIGDNIIFEFQFADTEAGKQLQYLYKNGFQKAFSIGFIPRAYVRVDDKTPDNFVVDTPSGEVEISMSKWEMRPRAIVTDWELLEISPVPVPSNPEALLLGLQGEALKVAEKAPVAVQQIIGAQVEQRLAELKSELEAFAKGDFVVKGAVATHSTPVDMESAWDANKARAQVAKWASEDGSGAKDTINWGKYAQGFAWFDEAKADNLGSYKLPHHTPKGNQLVAVWRGVTTAMASLLGARGGVDVGADQQAVYNHLAKHYKDAGKTPPPLKAYTEDELKAIEDGTWTPADTVEPKGADPDTKTDEPMVEKIKTALVKELLEVQDALDIQLRIIHEKMEEMMELLSDMKAGDGQQDNDDKPTVDEDELSKLAELTQEFKKFFGKE